MPVSEGVVSALIELKRTDDEGLVAQLTSQLRNLIATGRLGKGRALPSSRRLASDLGVSRNTVTYAFEQLAAEGYIEASHGRRPMVTADGGRNEGTGAVAPSVRSGRPRLSPWASKLKQTDWPMSYQAPLKPLRPGHGDAREFPHEVWARCLRRSAVRAAKRELGPVNRTRLRQALAHYLAASRGVRATADQILILPSAQAALTLIAAALITPGDDVWVEDPGYPGAAAAFRASGARVMGMKLDEQGMQRMPGRSAPKLIFMTPSHQHPTGRLMSLARRTEFLAMSRPRETWIVEDDYDGEFHYDSRPVPALQGLYAHGRVFYVGTFSKAMTPDIRLGYVVVPSGLVGTLEIAQRHIGLIASSHIQEALAEFIADGHFLAHLRRMRRLYHARRDHLVEGLERHLGEVLSAEVPSGGIQLVARLKRGRADQAAVQRLVAAGVETRALSSLALGRPRDHGLLLGFAAWRENEISAAVRTMASCF
ncbi:PLP-dependent aminotransferase family protein [Bradyrhizobium japonicum]|uniref:MocR-like pyridoxine biosynthesis transcription factor PdxR n=1 Tax=Bradyrhizobium japonicum TaxID=375 RepID=UPI00339895EA